MKDILVFILLSISMAAFAIQIAYASSLAFKLKTILQFNNRKIFYYKSFTSWVRILKRHFKTIWYLYPLILIIVLVLKIHGFIAELIDCPYCTVTWLMFFANHFYLKQDIVTSLIFAPIGIIMVKIIESIKNV